MEQFGSHWRIFITFDGAFLKNLFRKFEFHYNLTSMMAIIREEKYSFLFISRSLLLRTGNISDKTYRENQNTHFIPSKLYPENHVVYGIKRKNIFTAEQTTGDNMAHVHCMLDK
jgi:hypothetical protein